MGSRIPNRWILGGLFATLIWRGKDSVPRSLFPHINQCGTSPEIVPLAVHAARFATQVRTSGGHPFGSDGALQSIQLTNFYFYDTHLENSHHGSSGRWPSTVSSSGCIELTFADCVYPRYSRTRRARASVKWKLSMLSSARRQPRAGMQPGPPKRL